MTFEQLAYYVEVYRLRSITAAAENLYITRQTLSQAISRLEKEFDIQLFERTKDGLVPTEGGVLLYEYAESVISSRTVLNQEIERIKSEKAGNHERYRNRFTVGMAKSFLQVFGDVLLANLRSNSSDTFFQIVSVEINDFESILDTCDFYIMAVSPGRQDTLRLMAEKRGYRVSKFKDLEPRVWMSSSSRLANKSIVTCSDIASERLCYHKGSYDGPALLKYLCTTEPPLAVDLVDNFVDYVTYYDYYAFDFPIYPGHLFYEEYFDSEKTVCIPFETPFGIYFYYNPETSLNFYHTIAFTLAGDETKD